MSVLGVSGSATTLFNAGLIVTGVLGTIFAIGLGRSLLFNGLLGRLGVANLILSSAALSAMGIFPRSHDVPHNVSSLVFFLLISLAILLIGIKLMTLSQKRWGMLSLTVVILVNVFQLVPWPWNGGAIPQLLSVLPWSLWTISFSFRLLMNPKPTSI